MAEASQVGAQILRELRRSRGWSWQEQARLLKSQAERHGVERVASATTESIVRTIARWESGRYAYKPDERYQLLLAYVYATRDGEPAVGPGSDLDRLVTALGGEMGVSLGRRQVLRALATSAATVGSGALLAFLAPGLQGRLRPLRLADHAVRRAHDGSDRAVRARALAVQAEMRARKGDERGSLRTLDLARVHLAGDLDARSFDPARLDGFEGICRLSLGQPAAAGTGLRRCAHALDDARAGLQKSIILADLEMAHVRQGDPEAACEVLGERIELVARTRGRVARQRLRRVRWELQPWRAERFVEALDDRMLAALA